MLAVASALAAGGLYLQFSATDRGPAKRKIGYIDESVDVRMNQSVAHIHDENTRMARIDTRYGISPLEHAIDTKEITEKMNKRFAAISIDHHKKGSTLITIPTLHTQLPTAAVPPGDNAWKRALNNHPNVMVDGSALNRRAIQTSFHEPFGGNHPNPYEGTISRIQPMVRFGNPFGPGGLLTLPLNRLAYKQVARDHPRLKSALSTKHKRY